ncbi:MAG: cytochrome b/b6 domain-containing protein [Phenylobacterium sp.]|jgi:cytochrome b|uniref:cytochrome b/b6 domain-containing protein n=1 Tax=Phenylobacterium sp. TaxID=1871053 RepID=UPI002A364324|nr:cytochrome b/b6 domain-containing protein [Phenylobacterium sp.]MDX9999005.1 cytochrome b/b6 domain-containing protein [Phenylobacterium sp.]
MTGPAIRVWDPMVRVFHWGLVVSFALAWLTAESWEDLHHFAGYAAAALIGFRLVWGLAGPRYARFGQFVRRPSEVIGYLRAVARGREPRYLGHNPAGGAMIMMLILVMALTALTGWMYTTDTFWGADWVEETHEAAATAMLGLVALHVAGVVLASLRHKENLALAMLTGRKRPPGPADVA